MQMMQQPYWDGSMMDPNQMQQHFMMNQDPNQMYYMQQQYAQQNQVRPQMGMQQNEMGAVDMIGYGEDLTKQG